MGVLFIFSQINPLDGVPVDQITSVERYGLNLVYKLVDEKGEKGIRTTKFTEFQRDQINGFGIEKYGDEI